MGNVFRPLAPSGYPLPSHSLRRSADDGSHRVGEFDAFENFRADHRMNFHFLELFGCQLPKVFQMMCSGTASLPLPCNKAAA